MGRNLFPNVKVAGIHSYHCSLNFCKAWYDNIVPHFLIKNYTPIRRYRASFYIICLRESRRIFYELQNREVTDQVICKS